MEHENGAPATPPVAKTPQEVLATYRAGLSGTPPQSVVPGESTPPAANPPAGDTPPAADPKNPPAGDTPPAADPAKSPDISDLLKVPKAPDKEQFVPLSRLQEVIGKGKKTVEQKQAEIEHWKKQAEERQAIIDSLSDDQKAELEKAKKLGIKNVDSEIEENIKSISETITAEQAEITKAETEYTEGRNKWFEERKSQLTTALDGTNGLPKFDIDELSEFANKHQFWPEDPMILYQQAHFDAIVKHLASQKPPATAVEAGTPGKATDVVPPTFNYGDKTERDRKAREVLAKLNKGQYS